MRMLKKHIWKEKRFKKTNDYAKRGYGINKRKNINEAHTKTKMHIKRHE